MSPLPRSFSAPTWSRIVFESTPEVTANAILEPIFALITPVITSTEGLCVAISRCMPAALASAASLDIYVSTSFDATIMSSASSSITKRTSGRCSTSGLFLYFSLKLLISLTWPSSKSLYLLCISITAQLRAPAAFLGSVITGMMRCGTPL